MEKPSEESLMKEIDALSEGFGYINYHALVLPSLRVAGTHNGHPVYLRTSKIVAIYRDDLNYTAVSLDGDKDTYYQLDQTPEEVYEHLFGEDKK